MTTTTIEQLQQKALEATQHAREVSHTSEYVSAWEEVEELMQELNKRRQNKATTNLEEYCTLNPDSLECKEFDV